MGPRPNTRAHLTKRLTLALIIAVLWPGLSGPVAGQSSLDVAFDRLQSYDWGQTREALNPIDEAINTSASQPQDRKQLEMRLDAVLSGQAPEAAKRWACERLARIGSAESAPALGALLLNPRLTHSARNALTAIGGAQATTALRDAMARAEGDLKVGLINSLGQARDPASLELLTNALAGPDEAAARAAACALGSLGTSQAARALRHWQPHAPQPLRPALDAALLIAAEQLAHEKHPAEAAAVYQELFQPGNPLTIRLAAFGGLLTAQPEAAATLISQALLGNDEQLRERAARLLSTSGDLRLQPLVTDLKTYPPVAQAAILSAVRWRKDTGARQTVLAAIDEAQPSVRIAALQALGAIGREQDVPVLVRAAARRDGEEAAAARLALTSLPGGAVNDAVVADLATASPKERVELIHCLVERMAKETSRAIAGHLAETDQPVREAALAALGTLGGADQVAPLVRLLATNSDDQSRDLVEKTLDMIAARAGPTAAEPLLAGLEGTNTAVQIVLLRVLGIAGGARALEAVLRLIQLPESPLRGTAFRVLTEWSSAEALPELLRLAKSRENAAWGILAFRGYVRLCRENSGPAAERIRALSEALAVARNVEEKRLVISALGELHDPAALNLLTSQLTDSALDEEACLAIVEVAEHAGPQTNAIVPALRQVLRAATNSDIRNRARELLTRAGAKPE